MTSVNVQNTMLSFNNYRSNMMVAPSSLSSTWQYSKQRASMNQEERNDSGMGSCSDFVSSPDSVTDNSRSSPQLNVATTYYTSPMMIPSRATFSQNLDSSQIMFTNSPPTSSIPEPVSEKKSECSYPSPDESNANSYSGADGALQHLQHSLEKNGFLPTVQSPKPSESSVEDDNKSAMDTTEENGEPKLNSPTLNANGKLRTHKCKQCGFVALTKVELWKHQRQHMKAHKLLTCPQCQFVTEYKHHFEFHTRNHAGSKPFKCDQCDYSCVNKSMLNSHLKSHSNVYQYRCLNCNYATKYCHSLKQHLRKYDHQPDVVLNPDGTPNPLPIIDVCGTRRGPKIKRQENQVVEENTPKREQVPLNYMNQAIPPPQVVPPHVIPPQMPFPFSLFPLLPGFPGGMVNPFLLQDLERLVQAHQATQTSPPVSANNTPVADDSRSTCDEQNDEVLDLSKSAEPAQKKRNRRKGRSFKLDRSRNDNSESEDDTTTTVFANVEVVEDKDAIRIAEEQNHLNNNDSEKHSSCQHCDIQFKEPILYNIHMEYHSNINPFTCKKCGEECNDSVSFFMHIARVPHY